MKIDKLMKILGMMTRIFFKKYKKMNFKNWLIKALMNENRSPINKSLMKNKKNKMWLGN
jgi:hypothetical protein